MSKLKPKEVFARVVCGRSLWNHRSPPAANNIQGSGGLKGFTFDINGNCSGTCLSSGSFRFPGTAEQARAALRAAGAWGYGVFDLIDSSNIPQFGHHPNSEQFRFGAGPSPHFSVPDEFLQFSGLPNSIIVRNPRSTVPTTGDFHVDPTAGFSHGMCANFGIGCSK
jgi:hypothetical protein